MEMEAVIKEMMRSTGMSEEIFLYYTASIFIGFALALTHVVNESYKIKLQHPKSNALHYGASIIVSILLVAVTLVLLLHDEGNVPLLSAASISCGLHLGFCAYFVDRLHAHLT